MTREDWLNQATDLLRTDFKETTIPDKIRITCGWPSRGGRAKKKMVLGETWKPECSEDGTTEIFIAPTLSNGVDVLSVLIHELVHAAVGCEEGHKGRFKTTARSLGLEGALTATHAGEDLLVRLQAIKEELGAYPHAKLTPIDAKTQSTRMLKLQCPACGWAARTSQKWINVGLPTCICGTETETL